MMTLVKKPSQFLHS